MSASRSHSDAREEASISQLPGNADEQYPPWELIDTGRYQPRRIRGSLRGRELG